MTKFLHDVRPCAFMFAAPLQNEKAGESIDQAFLNALKEVDPKGLTDTRVYRGGLLLAQLSYKPSSIKVEPARHQKSNGPVIFHTSQISASDRDLYAVLVGDFVETCMGQWNTLDPSTFWNYVANRSLDATFVSSLSATIAEEMDNCLRSHPRYIGAISPDLGNPLHHHLFVEMMYKDAFIRGGRIFVQSDFEDTYDGSFRGADTFSKAGIEILSHQQFDELVPSAYLPDSISARGLVTEMRMHRRMALDVHQKVMNNLGQSGSLRDIKSPFEWSLLQLPDAPEEINIQAKKLTEYLLNLDYKDGGSKAKFFEQRLAITRKDWTYLHAQLIDRLGNVAYEDVRLDEHGVRFNAYLPVIGRNGSTATIKTGWIVRPGERASFVTAIPAKLAKQDVDLERQAAPPALIPENLQGDSRWQAIYDLATQHGSTAIQEYVAKPLIVEGHVYMEGSCGGAFIHIEDGRTSFVRWLKKNEIGSRNYRSGYLIPAEQLGQSAESAKAFADAFARVLCRNGIQCCSEIYLT